MRKDIAGPETESTMPLWEGLEGVVREKAQEFIQQILEEEVTELLRAVRSQSGRQPWMRRHWLSGTTAAVDDVCRTPHGLSASARVRGRRQLLREQGVASGLETDEGASGSRYQERSYIL